MPVIGELAAATGEVLLQAPTKAQYHESLRKIFVTETSASSPSPSSSSPDATDLLQRVLQTIGIAGGLAVIGYIAMISHQEFMGIQEDLATTTQLGFAAAGFWFDSVRIFLEACLNHPFIAFGVMAVFAAVPYLGFLLWRTPHRLGRITLALRDVLPAFICAWTLLMWELPTVGLRDAMMVSLCVQPGGYATGLIADRTNHFWSLLLDSRGGAHCLKAENTGKPLAPVDPAKAAAAIKDSYALILIVVISGWFMVCYRPEVRYFQPTATIRLISILSLSVATLLLPYSYGKLIWATTMPKIQVHLGTLQLDVPAKYAAASDVPVWLDGDNFLARESDKSVFVLNLDKQTTRLIEIPRTQLVGLEINEIKDALSERVKMESLAQPLPPSNYQK